MKLPSRARLRILLVGSVFFVSCLAALKHRDARAKQATFGPLVASCDGLPTEAAMPFRQGETDHHLLVAQHRADATGWEVDTRNFPRGTKEIGEIDVVVCVDKRAQVKLESCAFYRKKLGFRLPGTETEYPRVRRLARIRVIAAQTGTELLRTEVAGGLPLRCDEYRGKNPSASDFAGPEPDLEGYAKFVRSRLGRGE